MKVDALQSECNAVFTQTDINKDNFINLILLNLRNVSIQLFFNWQRYWMLNEYEKC